MLPRCSRKPQPGKPFPPGLGFSVPRERNRLSTCGAVPGKEINMSSEDLTQRLLAAWVSGAEHAANPPNRDDQAKAFAEYFVSQHKPSSTEDVGTLFIDNSQERDSA